VVARPLVAAGLALACAAQAAPPEGSGHLSLLAGWHLAPNDAFFAHAQSLGFARGSPSWGGPVALASFGYEPGEPFEVSIDLFGAFERLTLQNVAPIDTVTYGALLVGRVHYRLGGFGPFASVTPSAGIAGGPTLAYVTGGPPGSASEALNQGWAASVALAVGLRDGGALVVDARYLIAWGKAGNLGFFNAGGFWLSVGWSWSFGEGGGEPGRGNLPLCRSLGVRVKETRSLECPRARIRFEPGPEPEEHAK